MRDRNIEGRCKINDRPLMRIDGDTIIIRRMLAVDMERWDFIERQFRGRRQLYSIILHTSTAVLSMWKYPMNDNSSTVVDLGEKIL